MIQFTCGNCGRAFSVPGEFAGRRAKCKTCGTTLVVPAAAVAVGAAAAAAAAAPAPAPAGSAALSGSDELAADASTAPAAVPAAPTKIPMRTRRLVADARQMAEAFAGSELIKVRPVAGDPPEAYHVEYAVRGLERGPGNKPVAREHHLVEIRLTSEYPRTAPQCKMLTPVFHPNIDTSTVCVGDHWAAGERLVDLTVRIGEMIAYQAYNIQSPLDAEAAMWADLNAGALPVDSRSLRPGEA
jgi:ubiquitin-protein ligase